MGTGFYIPGAPDATGTPQGHQGAKKARKRAFYESSDAVRAEQRRLFRSVPWIRVHYPDATPALIQAYEQIAANPGDPTDPAWIVVAGPRPSSYPLLGPKYPLLGTMYPKLRVQGGS